MSWTATLKKGDANGEKQSLRHDNAATAGLLHDRMTIMAGGFGLCGLLAALIEAIRESGLTGLTIVSNNAGIDDVGPAALLAPYQIKKQNFSLDVAAAAKVTVAEVEHMAQSGGAVPDHVVTPGPLVQRMVTACI